MFNQGTGHRHMRNKQFYGTEGGFGERQRKPQVLGKYKSKERMIKEKLGIQWEGNNKRRRAKEDLTQEKETKSVICITTDKGYDELEL